MDLLELFLGQVPEAIYFALFLILVKRLKTKRILFTILMIVEYLLLKQFLEFDVWFQISYTIMTFLTLKVLYRNKAQITDIFTFGIASLILMLTSIISFVIFRPNMLFVSISNRIISFLLLFLFRYKLCNIQEMYKKLWNRNDKRKINIKTYITSMMKWLKKCYIILMMKKQFIL